MRAVILATDHDAIVADLQSVSAMVAMLQEGEWAEHAGKGPVSKALEEAITELHNEQHELKAERDHWKKEAVRITSAVCSLAKLEFDNLSDDTKLIEVMTTIREAIMERDALRAEVDALRRDAERYRWLRDRDLDTIHVGGIFAGMTPENVVVNGEDLDQAIDAANLGDTVQVPAELTR